MENEVILRSFPSNQVEALAFLYVQNQDLSGKTPAEIEKMYQAAYTEIEQSEDERGYDFVCQVN